MAKKERPQNKNLIPISERTPEEKHAIQSAGGKASQEARKKRQQMADLLLLYSGLPIKDGRVKKRLARLGIPEEELTQKMHIVDALIRMAQAGNVAAISLYLEATGELGVKDDGKDNNLFDMIKASSSEEVSVDDIPEILEAPDIDDDLVEPSETEGAAGDSL